MYEWGGSAGHVFRAVLNSCSGRLNLRFTSGKFIRLLDVLGPHFAHRFVRGATEKP